MSAGLGGGVGRRPSWRAKEGDQPIRPARQTLRPAPRPNGGPQRAKRIGGYPALGATPLLPLRTPPNIVGRSIARSRRSTCCRGASQNLRCCTAAYRPDGSRLGSRHAEDTSAMNGCSGTRSSRRCTMQYAPFRWATLWTIGNHASVRLENPGFWRFAAELGRTGSSSKLAVELGG